MSGSRRLRLVRSYLAGRPVWCSWQVSPRCVSQCVACEHRAYGSFEAPPLEACLRLVERLDALGTLIVSLTGGDPLLRSDLPEIVRALARRHVPLLTTHGWLVTAERARAAWQAGLAAASVALDHGAQGGPAELETARPLRALATLCRERSSPSQRVNLKLRLHGEDAVGLELLLERAGRLGASATVEPAFPVARGAQSGLARRLLALKRRYPNLMSSRAFLAEFDRALADGVPGCQAGRASFNVDHRGRVSKCVEFRRPEDQVGELGGDSLTALLPRLREEQRRNTCRSCWYASRGEVEGLYSVKGALLSLPLLIRA
jgi:MoaA/NifB/PqqE/SkfB family radical SAM enzyme